jgi:hypothetical protein
MPGKFSFEFVRNEFLKEGYELLSEEYINCKQKLKFICPNGHEYQTRFDHWSRGARCAVCAGNAKLTIEFIRKEFEKEGYLLLESCYVNNKQNLGYSCPNGHLSSISWDRWQRGSRCIYCAGLAKYSIDFVRCYFEKEGYKLLEKEYKSNSQRLACVCPQGHERRMTFWNFQKGHRCRTCADIDRTGPNSSLWKGGISFEPYCHIWLDRDFKDDIKRRDNYECQNIFCEGKYTRLCVHHIDYVKKNCHPSNLITLCNSCNAKANFDREWHEAFYKEIMKRKLAVLKNSQ